MRVETEGVVLRQSSPVDGRRMVVLFTKDYGKISAGTSLSDKGRNKSKLVLSPFTRSGYSLYRKRDSFSISSGEVIRSYYSIGENIDKYMAGSYVLEFTDKVLTEGEKAPAMYNLLIDFFEELSIRKSRYETLVLAYQVKVIKILGLMPELDECVCCGRREEISSFSVKDGGILCGECLVQNRNEGNSALIYNVSFDIVNILKFFMKRPLSDLRKLALKGELLNGVQDIIKSYISYHLDINKLKSEGIKLD